MFWRCRLHPKLILSVSFTKIGVGEIILLLVWANDSLLMTEGNPRGIIFNIDKSEL